MFVHIGKEQMVSQKDLIGIFDIKSIENTIEYKNLYNKLKKDNNICNISGNTNESLILVQENRTIKAYISNISSITIAKRSVTIN